MKTQVIVNIIQQVDITAEVEVIMTIVMMKEVALEEVQQISGWLNQIILKTLTL
ncbi:hypothetical protein D3C72_1370310 [compost metagenome]